MLISFGSKDRVRTLLVVSDLSGSRHNFNLNCRHSQNYIKDTKAVLAVKMMVKVRNHAKSAYETKFLVTFLLSAVKKHLIPIRAPFTL